MASQPAGANSDRNESGAVSVDEALDRILEKYRKTGRTEMASEAIRATFRDRLTHAGFAGRDLHLLEANLLGNVSGWIEFALEERAQGRNIIPDAVRQFRTVFLAHCRQQRVNPDDALAMAIELATAVMEMACAFRRQFTIGSGSSQQDAGGKGKPPA